MNSFRLLAFFVALTLFSQSTLLFAAQITSFDANWRFARFGLMPDGTTNPEPKSLQAPDFNDSQWRQLNLPHDWAIEGPFLLDQPNRTGKRAFAGIGWYRKYFTIPNSDKNKRIFIDFDGAMSQTQVWLNGTPVGQWPYGYASFRIELTDAVKFGQTNCLAVRLNNPPDSSRWYPGGGIYRHTWLVKTNPIHIDHWGTYITTPKINQQRAVVHVQTTLINQSNRPTDSLQIFSTVLNPSGKRIASPPPVTLSLQPGAVQTASNDLIVTAPRLWDIESPNLYQLETRLTLNGKTLDTQTDTFGIRTIEFKPESGFFLNGRRVPLNGVCNHHDLGPLGAAMHVDALKRQLSLLREMGCNAIRTSHNPPAPELPALCDQMGFLLMDEAFDCWASGKTENDYHQFFPQWHKKDLAAMIHRDRNHPSVILWSSGNEIREQGQKPDGHDISRQLTAIIHREDPTRPVTAGCNNPGSATNGFADTIDVFGFNYKPHLYKDFRKNRPQQPFYSSESSSCISTRGEYFFPVSDKKNEGFFNYQVSSYDLYAPPWAMPPDWEFKGQDQNAPAVAGEFVWTGFDYLGEPTPYNKDKSVLLNYHSEAEKQKMLRQIDAMGGKAPSRSSYFGILDLCGFKKDRFYIYQARWRPDFPMAHILPHWNWPERIGKVTPVHVYTSGDEAELFLNGKSLGKRTKSPFQYRLRWDDVIYQPGTLTVKVTKNGLPWAQATQSTTGQPVAVELISNRQTINTDGQSLCFITARIIDDQGRLVPRTHNPLTFTVKGPGRIIATGNGDPTSQAPFQTHHKKAFNGLCLAIIQSQPGQTGAIEISASSPNLKTDTIKISAR